MERVLYSLIYMVLISITIYTFVIASFNPLVPNSDQDRISPYTISTISSRQVMRIKKISIRGLLVDPNLNSPN